MLLRKINAILSLLSTFFLLNHAISSCVWIFTGGRVILSLPYAPWILLWLVATHALLCIYFAISSHIGGEKRKAKHYPKLNAATLFQRVSGILLIPTVALHVAGARGVIAPPYLVHLILPSVFFAIALGHAAVSVDKAFITLGIGNAKAIRVIGILAKLICAAVLIASVVSFVSYYAS